MKKRKFIVLEGTDGSGKATQLKLLVKWLKKQGFRVAETDFPQYYTSFFGKLVGRFLKGEFGGIDEVNPFAILAQIWLIKQLNCQEGNN